MSVVIRRLATVLDVVAYGRPGVGLVFLPLLDSVVERINDALMDVGTVLDVVA